MMNLGFEIAMGYAFWMNVLKEKVSGIGEVDKHGSYCQSITYLKGNVLRVNFT